MINQNINLDESKKESRASTLGAEKILLCILGFFPRLILILYLCLVHYTILLLAFALGLAATFLILKFLGKNSSPTNSDDFIQKSNALASAEASLSNAHSELNRLREQMNSLQEENKILIGKLAGKDASFDALNLKLKEQGEEMNRLQEQFSKEFENLANRIFEEKSKKFTEQNRNNLDILLSPLKEKLTDFEKKVDTAYKSEAAERNSLRGEIKNLIEASARVSVDAGNLARALTGDQKQHGNWGELILDKVLERSGLVKGKEYDTQVSSEAEDGKRIQPDVIVYLPDEKHIVVDSKVSLVAYNELVNCSDEEQRKTLLVAHIESLRRHIKGLSEKSYQSAKGVNAPDFVLMFIPIESSFSIAIQEDTELFHYAWDRKIVIVSPTTLLATLKTIASLWKQERQSRNVMEIAEESGKLYDKFVGFVEDLIAIGKKMDDSKKSYEEAMNKLSKGSGNLVGRAEKIKKLGAKAGKQINPTLVERAESDPELNL